MTEPPLAHNPSVTLLHDGPAYRVRFLRCSTAPRAVVEFTYWLPEPSLDSEFPVEGFCRHRGLNAIGVLCARNDWYQDDEIMAVLDAIRAATPDWTLIGYGGSMGGYAAINFAAALGLQSLFAVCPQYSIDAARVPYETRWRAEAARIGFAHDHVDAPPRLQNGWLLYDPWCVDGRHAADIARHHDLRHIRVPLTRHEVMRAVQQAELFTPMVLDVLEDRFDLPAFRRTWRHRRRQSAAFWITLGTALLARGQITGAERALAQARALPHPQPREIEALAEAIAMAGDSRTETPPKAPVEGHKTAPAADRGTAAAAPHRDGLAARADYGQDAPETVRGLGRRAAAFLAIAGVLAFRPFGLPAGLDVGFLIGAALQGTIVGVMIWSSRRGKLALRDRLLDGVAWPPGATVLDVGCGRGLALLAAAERAGGLALGVDIWSGRDQSGNGAAATRANAAAEGVADRILLATADARALPLPASSIDVVVSMTALHNIAGATGRAEALAEIVRVLRPGGQLALFDIFFAGSYRRVLRDAGMQEVAVSWPIFLWCVPGRRMILRKPVVSP